MRIDRYRERDGSTIHVLGLEIEREKIRKVFLGFKIGNLKLEMRAVGF
jgi:hypothetical protein